MPPRRFSGSPISAQKEQLSKAEEELRRKMSDLERVIAEAPKMAEAELERQKQERVARATTRRSAFDAPDVLQDSRYQDDLFTDRPSRPRRAQRRAARTRLLVMSFAVLIAVLVVLFLGLQLVRHL
jgi:Flp pilus assembly protein TadB